MRKVYIDFMGNRNWLFLISGIIILVGIASIFVRGLNYGIEFRGGTAMTFDTGGKTITETQLRDALGKNGVPAESIQPVQGVGFLVRSTEASSGAASTAFAKVNAELGLTESGGNVTTIGPGWGKNVQNAAMLAFILSIAAILLYISLRFEYKMSVTAVIALVHDLLVTVGIYALLGREITPNTIAAILTILGYSLYDTIVVFHRIRENSQHLVKQTFMQMANDSINQVLARWINTGLASLIPVVVLLIFGGETLKDFAFALTVGLLSGAYSSVAIASPLYAMWKETEPKFQALKKKYASA
jgi:SecD/SecF fusion protein